MIPPSTTSWKMRLFSSCERPIAKTSFRKPPIRFKKVSYSLPNCPSSSFLIFFAKAGLFPEVEIAIERAPFLTMEGTIKLQSAGWSTALTSRPLLRALSLTLLFNSLSSVAAITMKASSKKFVPHLFAQKPHFIDLNQLFKFIG